MRKGRLGNAGWRAGSRNVKEQLQAGNPKFHAGPDPLEQELGIKIIRPQTRHELDQMTAMLQAIYDKNPTPEGKQALALWKFEVAKGTVLDSVRLEFLRGFYFWLLGRGSDAQTKKTFWGRANVATVNGEVAAYLRQFMDRRTEYAQKLLILSQRVPETLNGYYLYYKYIVNGGLKQVDDGKGNSFFDLSNEDYLEDFDLFQQVFDGDGSKPAYADIIAPASNRPKDKAAFDGVVPYPLTEQNLKDEKRANRVSQLDPGERAEQVVDRLSMSLDIGDKNASMSKSRLETTADKESAGPTDSVPKTSDIDAADGHANAPPVVPSADYSFLGRSVNESDPFMAVFDALPQDEKMDVADVLEDIGDAPDRAEKVEQLRKDLIHTLKMRNLAAKVRAGWDDDIQLWVDRDLSRIEKDILDPELREIETARTIRDAEREMERRRVRVEPETPVQPPKEKEDEAEDDVPFTPIQSQPAETHDFLSPEEQNRSVELENKSTEAAAEIATAEAVVERLSNSIEMAEKDIDERVALVAKVDEAFEKTQNPLALQFAQNERTRLKNDAENVAQLKKMLTEEQFKIAMAKTYVKERAAHAKLLLSAKTQNTAGRSAKIAEKFNKKREELRKQRAESAK